MEKKKTPALPRNVAKVLLVSATVGRPMMTTPGTPPDRVKLLRDVYVKTLKDPAVVEEAKKVKMDLEILTGAEVEAQIRDVMNQPKDVIERVKKLSE
jgi:tripartite-type tricarboxylate transporter receptor subunit TctC